MGMTNALFDAALKDYYTDDRVINAVYMNRPFLAMVPKGEEFPGRKLPIPIIFGNPQGVSASFTQAQTRAASVNSNIEAFDLTRVNMYGVATMTTEVMESSEGNEGAWLEARTTEIDGVINAVANQLAGALYRGGWGKVAARGSASGSTITVSQLADIHNIEVGQEHVFSSSEDSAVLRDAGDSLIVSGVNRNAGIITYTTAVSNVAGMADGDTIFVKGNREDSATPTRLLPAGLSAWNPSSSPSAASFFGVDRTADSRLGGNFYNGVPDGTAIEDALFEGLNRHGALGNKPDTALMGFQNFARLTKNIHDLTRFVKVTVGDLGFEAFNFHGPTGQVKVVPDQFCPLTTIHVVELAALKLHSIGKAVRIIKNDGLMVLRQATADGVEVRTGFKGNLGCRNPNALMNIITAAP